MAKMYQVEEHLATKGFLTGEQSDLLRDFAVGCKDIGGDVEIDKNAGDDTVRLFCAVWVGGLRNPSRRDYLHHWVSMTVDTEDVDEYGVKVRDELYAFIRELWDDNVRIHESSMTNCEFVATDRPPEEKGTLHNEMLVENGEDSHFVLRDDGRSEMATGW